MLEDLPSVKSKEGKALLDLIGLPEQDNFAFSSGKEELDFKRSMEQLMVNPVPPGEWLGACPMPQTGEIREADDPSPEREMQMHTEMGPTTDEGTKDPSTCSDDEVLCAYCKNCGCHLVVPSPLRNNSVCPFCMLRGGVVEVKDEAQRNNILLARKRSLPAVKSEPLEVKSEPMDEDDADIAHAVRRPWKGSILAEGAESSVPQTTATPPPSWDSGKWQWKMVRRSWDHSSSTRFLC